MDDEKLIFLVEQNDVLYNKYNRFFKYPEKKMEVWQEIAKEMGVHKQYCIRRWTSLRERFTQECRRFERNNNYKTLWPYMEIMNFIKPYITGRPDRRKSELETVRRCVPLKVESPQSCPLSQPCHSTIASINQSSETYEEEPLISTSLLSKNNKNHNDNNSQSETIDFLNSICEQEKAKLRNPAVHAFKQMIVSTICSMNSRNQIRAIQQVTDIVMSIKLEEKDLLDQDTINVT